MLLTYPHISPNQFFFLSRELLCEIVSLKMTIYDFELPACSSLEEYLKTFLEAEVKPLWPKGWMQSRYTYKQYAILNVELGNVRLFIFWM